MMFRIDPATGAVVSQFDYFPGEAGPYFDGLAYVPEPATLSLLAFGGVMLIRRRKQ